MSEFPFSSLDERIRQAADQLFAEAKHVNEITRERIFALVEGPGKQSAFRRVFPGDEFPRRRRAWLRRRVEQAIEQVFALAQFPRDVTFQQIADLAGCGRDSVIRLARAQIRARRQALATPQQRALQVIEQLVEARVPVAEYTWERVFREAGKSGRMYLTDDLTQAFRDGREKLASFHRQPQQQRMPGAAYAYVQGDWVNVDEATWYFPSIERTLRRDQLRPDIVATPSRRSAHDFPKRFYLEYALPKLSLCGETSG